MIMKRVFVSILSLLLVATMAMAIPAKRGQWKTLRLSDGTEVRAELVGDEFGHFYRTADGQCFVKDYDASTEQSSVYKTADMTVLMAKANAKRMEVRKAQAQKAPRLTINGGSHEAYAGTKKGLVILVQFADKKFADGHDQALYNRIVNETGYSEGNFKGSVRDYYYAQSGGQFTIDFDVVGPVTLDKSYAYYGRDNDYIKDVNIQTMVKEALQAADSEVNYKDYDWDGDGTVEQVFLLYAGQGQATSDDENTIWPHMSSLVWPNLLTLDGVRLRTYACSNELLDDTNIYGIGAMCHEFSHCMGLPDMYDTSGGGSYGMCSWDIMDQGCYNGDTFTPAGYTAYERMYCGWLQPIELTDGLQVSGMKALSDGGDAYIVHNGAKETEYYLLENRQLTGWDAALYGKGLLVYYVDFDSDIWSNNIVNTVDGTTNDHQRCTVLPADNNTTATTTGVAGDTYPFNGNIHITANTTPSMTLYNANTDGTKLINLAVLNITQNEDGTMSFNVKDNSKIGEDTKPDGAIFYESFNLCSGTGGNDGLWSGATGNYIPDCVGWVASQTGGGDKCARFGSNTQRGYATTPEITIDGTYTLNFKAAPYSGGGTTLTLSSNNSDITLGEASVTMASGQWTDYSVTMSGTGTTTITFRTNKQRFFLDEVSVTPPSAGISDITIDPAASGKQRIYTIDGRYAGTNIDALKRGVYIVGGKKILK